MRTLPRLLGEARSALPGLTLALVAGTVAATSGIGLTATAAWLIARAAQRPPVLELGVAVVAVRGFGLGRGFARYAERLGGHEAALRVLGRLRVRSYERLIPQAAIARGDALQRFASDVDAGLDLLIRVLLPYAAALLAVAGAATLLGLIDPAAAVLVVGLLAVVGVAVPLLQSSVARRESARTASLRAELTTGVVELLRTLPELVAYGLTGLRLAALRQTDNRLRAAQARASLGVGIGQALVVATAGGCVWALLAIGVHAHLASPLLAVLVLTPLAVLDVVAVLPESASRYGLGRAALRRVYTVMDHPDPVPEPRTPSPLPDGPYELRVRDVTVRWGETEPPILAGLNLHLPPGRRVALVGPSGCGKTTLAHLLVRFLDPDAGEVTLNGVSLRCLDSDELRRVVVFMDDRGHCFDTTIGANLRVGRPDATDPELWRALAQARLDVWVRSLPHGLDTDVGEHGARLSGGQRRRLALARALVTGAPILVLDEPTEHLDDETAAALTADLLDATTGRTVLLITHRPFGLSDVDDVVRLG
jgi:thiol reductant ABC exporter CydC subunit